MARATATKLVAPVVALAGAVLAAVYGKHVDGVSISEAGKILSGILVGILGAIHGPKVVHKIPTPKPKPKPKPVAEFVDMMDTIGPDAGNIPRSCRKILAYITGPGVAWAIAAIKAAAKHADVIACDQSDNTNAYRFYRTLILDVENGAKEISHAIIQIRARAKLGLRSTAYTFEANEAEFRREVALAGLTSWVDWLIADWNLNRDEAIARLRTDKTLVGIQWASPTENRDTICPGTNRTLGELNIDLSVTRGLWT